jgi:ABC-type glycerol-3-phosphate transport system substrate-binding protein
MGNLRKLQVTFGSVCCFMLVLLSIAAPIAGQEPRVTITVQLMQGMEYLSDANVFGAFKEQHPHIKLHILYADPRETYQPQGGISLDEHLAGVERYSASADVLLTRINTPFLPEISVEAIYGRYYLDLNPVILADGTFNTEEFKPAIWSAVSWDGGVWMLPAAMHIDTIIYHPQAFAEAGLAEPTPSWGVEEYMRMIEALTLRDADGKAIQPGFIGFNRGEYALLYSLLGVPLLNTSTFPNTPQLDRADVIALADKWAALYRSGAVYTPEYDYGEFEVGAVPLTVDTLLETAVSAYDAQAVLLPGGRAGMRVIGFAISGKTQHPDATYEVLKFLAGDKRIVDAVKTTMFAVDVARLRFPEVDAVEDAPYNITSLDEENKVLLQEAVQNAIHYPELRFFDYFVTALWDMKPTQTSSRNVLQDAQIRVTSALEQASNRGGQFTGVVPTPVPLAVSSPGEVVLKFRVGTPFNPSNPSAWDAFLQQFTADDPEVVQVILEHQEANPRTTAALVDCFYLPYNAVSVLDPSTILSLDALMSADPGFNPDDLLGTIRTQLQLGDRIMAFPIDIRPLALWYDAGYFAEYDIPAPSPDWTTAAFVDTLQRLTYVDSSPALGSMQPGTSLLMLIAAYGGLPLDYRTSPPTVDFTNGQYTEAIQQVLELIKSGSVRYSPLTSLRGGPAAGDEPLLVADFDIMWMPDAAYLPLAFPTGTQFAPTAFTLGTAYISAQSPHPEA